MPFIEPTDLVPHSFWDPHVLMPNEGKKFFFVLFLVCQVCWQWGCTIHLHFSLPESPPLQPWCPYSSLSDLPLYCLSRIFGCLPLFLLPLMLQCSTLVSNLFAAILFTCPNHRTLPRQISSHNVSVCWSWLGEKLSMCHHKWNCSWSAYMPFLEPVGGQTTLSKTYGQYNLPIIAIIIWHTHT